MFVSCSRRRITTESTIDMLRPLSSARAWWGFMAGSATYHRNRYLLAVSLDRLERKAEARRTNEERRASWEEEPPQERRGGPRRGGAPGRGKGAGAGRGGAQGARGGGDTAGTVAP